MVLKPIFTWSHQVCATYQKHTCKNIINLSQVCFRRSVRVCNLLGIGGIYAAYHVLVSIIVPSWADFVVALSTLPVDSAIKYDLHQTCK